MFQQAVQARVREIIRDEHDAAGEALVEPQPRLHLPVVRPDDDAGPVREPQPGGVVRAHLHVSLARELSQDL